MRIRQTSLCNHLWVSELIFLSSFLPGYPRKKNCGTVGSAEEESDPTWNVLITKTKVKHMRRMLQYVDVEVEEEFNSFYSDKQ